MMITFECLSSVSQRFFSELKGAGVELLQQIDQLVVGKSAEGFRTEQLKGDSRAQPSAYLAEPSETSSLAREVGHRPRQFYVLYSGMNDEQNYAAGQLDAFLRAQGIPAEQIIIASNPVVTFDNPCHEANRTFIRRWADKTAALIVNIEQYVNYADTGSRDSICSASEVMLQLKSREFNRAGGDEIVMIGHSMGGQRAITTSEILRERGQAVSKIITLGSPIARPSAQEEVIGVISDADPVLILCDVPYGPLNRFGSEKCSAIDVPGADHLGYFSDANLRRYIGPVAIPS